MGRWHLVPKYFHFQIGTELIFSFEFFVCFKEEAIDRNVPVNKSLLTGTFRSINPY